MLTFVGAGLKVRLLDLSVAGKCVLQIDCITCSGCAAWVAVCLCGYEVFVDFFFK